MYTPANFAITETVTITDFLPQDPFAQLTSFNGSEPVVSHVPLLLDENAGENGQLIGQLARVNSQWEHANQKTILAVFTGPHAYISSSWYETPKMRFRHWMPVACLLISTHVSDFRHFKPPTRKE